jgi:hypothetical protein
VKNFLRGLLHVGAAGSAADAVINLTNGHAVTSGNVLLPALAAFAAAVLHAALPALLAVDQNYSGK